MHITNPGLQSSAEGSARTTASPQLVKAANAFEANFLGELLKPLREDPLFGNGSGLGGDSLGSDGSGGGSMATIGSLASDALAQAIAKQGGLGIARMVLAQLAPLQQTAAQTAVAAGSSGPQCGDCAQALIIGQEAAAGLDPGSLEMLGKGNVSPAASASAKNAVDRFTRGATSEQRRGGFESVPVVRAIGSVRK